MAGENMSNYKKKTCNVTEVRIAVTYNGDDLQQI